MFAIPLIRVRYGTCLLIAVLATTIGCSRDISPGVDLQHATKVTFDQLKAATQGESHFIWIGSDADFHYFKTKNNGFYRLSTAFKMPRFQMRIDREAKPGSFEIEVVILNGKSISYNVQ